MVRKQAQAGVPAYLYLFDHCDAASRRRDLCAFHASELPYVFGDMGAQAQLPPNWPRPAAPQDAALSQAMIGYWVSFARTGRPEAPGLPGWKPYSQGEAYMHFTDRPVAAGDPLPGMFQLQEELVRRRRAAGEQFFLNVGLAATPVPDR
jgi:para-nitrobenzyl esterase